MAQLQRIAMLSAQVLARRHFANCLSPKMNPSCQLVMNTCQTPSLLRLLTVTTRLGSFFMVAHSHPPLSILH